MIVRNISLSQFFQSLFSLSCSLYIYFCALFAPVESACSGDSDCPNEKACINRQCLEVCSVRGACGENALCHPVLHNVRCSCPECHTGSPEISCLPDPKCEVTHPHLSDPIACGSNSDCPFTMSCLSDRCQNPCLSGTIKCDINKKCEVRRHRAMCVCKNGFSLSETGELSCAPNDLECSFNDQCTSNLACVKGKCVSPCTSKTCPEKKTCAVMNHRPVCLCTKDCNPSLSICLRDNGCPPQLACANYRCVNPCVNTTCPQEAPCFVEDHKPVCKFCPSGFSPDTKYGCLKGKNPKMT